MIQIPILWHVYLSTSSKERYGPPFYSDADGKIVSCFMENLDTCISDMSWVFLIVISKQNLDSIPFSAESTKQMVPFWTGFYKRLSDVKSEFSFVAYAPVIDAKPSDMATVFTTMKQCLDMSKRAGQQYALQTFDQQLYAVAQQVKWSMPDVFQSHIIRLGGFHGFSCFIGTVGKLWASSGL
ncbi:unnamed protein product [Mytilus coruscus]|uniref:Uncharacterized protein n=1 Tax=Mytilus coruscus TaxID=42192 RepID=A0A6J8A4Y4_MYTCO|nr:unnamed protein product [Mytilus coruscus]